MKGSTQDGPLPVPQTLDRAALYHRERDGQVTGDSPIIAASRGEHSHDEFLAMVENGLKENLGDGEFQQEVWDTFRSRLHYVKCDAHHPGEWHGLNERLSGCEDRIRVAYLATAPSLFGSFANGLAHNKLITDKSRIVLEKPLGRDFESAREINDQVGACFEENQVFRIDHYLGKETVQNLLACGDAAQSTTCKSPSPKNSA